MGRIIFLSKSRHQFQGLYKGSLLVYITRGGGREVLNTYLGCCSGGLYSFSKLNFLPPS